MRENFSILIKWYVLNFEKFYSVIIKTTKFKAVILLKVKLIKKMI